eukprot:CAMPEP_0168755832 /NCGR_PEP_ID=MMETSP0724-20121128/20280_1 /TAXON_ID=265536 /ORGANISM="Amphiprora sp., Strain CCMP467" /LENGTH=353 /DNA_ID=CAMNT_0008804475 /DNA_START=58 /DNA_END=1117 /DNA_ORIENTATION=-
MIKLARLLMGAWAASLVTAFVPGDNGRGSQRIFGQPQPQQPTSNQECNEHGSNNSENNVDTTPSTSTNNRRHFFQAIASAALSSSFSHGSTTTTRTAWADDGDSMTVAAAAATPPPTTNMKEFFDPYGLFSIQVPEGFYTLRRKAKGDLPDEKTGKGRRGSSIFTAGNMAKAEVVAVERFPTRVLLEENGIEATAREALLNKSQNFTLFRFPTRVLLEENGIEATGSLSTFPDIGDAATVAKLINLRREKDKPGNSNTFLEPASVKVSADGKELNFKLRTEIDVQKPELLMEEYGVSQLFRVTAAKASLNANDGNLLAVFASALETDFNSPDGLALQRTVDSFQAMNQAVAGS